MLYILQVSSHAFHGPYSLDRAFLEALWDALRSYFGESNLPPLPVAEAYREGNRDPYSNWDLWVAGEINANQVTTLNYDREHDLGILYIEVDHSDHLDVLMLRDDLVDLFLRHQEGSIRHADTATKLFQPLQAALRQRGLVAANLPMEVTFVDQQGLHTAPLAVVLARLGLS